MNSDFPVLKNSFLLLREFKENDINCSFKLKKVSFQNEFSQLYNEKKQLFWTVIEKKTKKKLGICGFKYIDKQNNFAILNFNLDNINNIDLAINAIKMVIEYGFNILKLKRIENSLISNNLNCIKILEKNGFKFESIQKN